MSYNIDTNRYINGTLFITRENHEKLAGLDICECSWIKEIHWEDTDGPDAVREIEKPWWYGEGSGSRYDEFKESLTYTHGEADIVCTWEGGDSHSGIRVRNGVVEERGVVLALAEDGDE